MDQQDEEIKVKRVEGRNKVYVGPKTKLYSCQRCKKPTPNYRHCPPCIYDMKVMRIGDYAYRDYSEDLWGEAQ